MWDIELNVAGLKFSRRVDDPRGHGRRKFWLVPRTLRWLPSQFRDNPAA